MPRENKQTPYTNSRYTYSNYFIKAKAETRFWQIATLLSLLITVLITGSYIIEKQASKFIPYIVEVNQLGQTVTSHLAEKALPADPRIIKATLAQFITNLRTVTPDTTLQKIAIQNVYAHILDNTPALQLTNKFYSTESSNPFKRAKSNIINIEILSVLSLTKTSWQVTWLEHLNTNQGNALTTSHYTAVLQILIQPSTEITTEDEIRKNPLGIFINNYAITQEKNN